MDAAEHDHLGVVDGGGLAQSQRIAHHIREILDLVRLIVVGQDDRPALVSQALHFRQ